MAVWSRLWVWSERHVVSWSIQGKDLLLFAAGKEHGGFPLETHWANQLTRTGDFSWRKPSLPSRPRPSFLLPSLHCSQGPSENELLEMLAERAIFLVARLNRFQLEFENFRRWRTRAIFYLWITWETPSRVPRKTLTFIRLFLSN